MKRVTGIGRILFKSENPSQLFDWYEKLFGIQRESRGQEHRFTGANRRQQTAPSPVPKP